MRPRFLLHDGMRLSLGSPSRIYRMGGYPTETGSSEKFIDRFKIDIVCTGSGFDEVKGPTGWGCFDFFRPVYPHR